MPLRRPPHDFIPALHRRHRHRHHQGNCQCSPSLGALLPHHFLSASSSSTILSADRLEWFGEECGISACEHQEECSGKTSFSRVSFILSFKPTNQPGSCCRNRT